LIPNPYKSEEDFWSGNMASFSKPKKVREPKPEGTEESTATSATGEEGEKPKKKRSENKENKNFEKKEKKEKKVEKKVESATTVEKNEVIQQTLINDTSVSWGKPTTSTATVDSSKVNVEDFPTLNQEKKKKKKKETSSNGVTSSENKRVDHSVVFEYENDAPDSKKVRLEENQEEVSVQ
jgi:hypothetical protein